MIRYAKSTSFEHIHVYILACSERAAKITTLPKFLKNHEFSLSPTLTLINHKGHARTLV